ncbi:MAG TPA: hypothetical protein PK969_13710, partial [Treponemataceae bacterium]|nr:hypothetical protein [Treponemataceae bacterium]
RLKIKEVAYAERKGQARSRGKKKAPTYAQGKKTVETRQEVHQRIKRYSFILRLNAAGEPLHRFAFFLFSSVDIMGICS